MGVVSELAGGDKKTGPGDKLSPIWVKGLLPGLSPWPPGPHCPGSPPELWARVFPELFLPPVLSAIPSPKLGENSTLTLRCQTKLHPQWSTKRLLFSFHKNDHALQDRSYHPELSIPEVKKRDSGLYWCEVTLEGRWVQKQSPQLEIKVQGKWVREGEMLPRVPGIR